MAVGIGAAAVGAAAVGAVPAVALMTGQVITELPLRWVVHTVTITMHPMAAACLRRNGGNIGGPRTSCGGHPKCVIADLQMPTMSGLALQQRLVDEGFHIPMIMITAQCDAVLSRSRWRLSWLSFGNLYRIARCSRPSME